MMKNFKFSLNALAAMCCLVLFATSCQDDVAEVDNDLQVEDNFQPKLQGKLTSAGARVASESPFAVGDEAVAFEVSVSLFEFDFGGDSFRGDLVEEYTGILSLERIEGIPAVVNRNLVGFDGRIGYDGNLALTDSEGNPVNIPVGALATEDEEATDAFFIGEVPGTDGAAEGFGSGFLPDGFETLNPNGGYVLSDDDNSSRFLLVIEEAEPIIPNM